MREHLSREQLARFAGASCPPEQARQAYAHIIECPRCFQAYAARVGGGSPWLRADPTAAVFVRPLLRRRRLARLAAAAATVALLVALDTPALHTPDPVLAEAVGRISSAGFVLPGAESAGEDARVIYRSGATPGNVAESLAGTIVASREQPGCPSAAVWSIAGLLAADRVDEARARAETARRRFPEDPRIPLLRAAVAYRESRLEEGEDYLRASLRLDPRGVAARFDLALLLSETGRAGAAVAILEELVDEVPGTLPGRRAADLLVTLR